jgi:hypothetical protein
MDSLSQLYDGAGYPGVVADWTRCKEYVTSLVRAQVRPNKLGIPRRLRD